MTDATVSFKVSGAVQVKEGDINASSNSKKLRFYVTGVTGVKAYACNTGSADANRTLSLSIKENGETEVITTPITGSAGKNKACSVEYKSLSVDKKYLVDLSNADDVMAVYAVRFIVDGSVESTTESIVLEGVDGTAEEKEALACTRTSEAGTVSASISNIGAFNSTKGISFVNTSVFTVTAPKTISKVEIVLGDASNVGTAQWKVGEKAWTPMYEFKQQIHYYYPLENKTTLTFTADMTAKDSSKAYSCYVKKINVTYADIDLDDIVTGIQTVKSTKAANDSAIYNLAGQKVSDGFKGIAIQNGRKVILK